ncbi:hypothetical protein HDZ31DRAFT_41634 [Schizophyllum fasciatum]
MASRRNALWDQGHDEAVQVNQRALIDKVLARYSGEFTVFRELLQNSDDAQSKAVEIHFESQEYLSSKSGDAAEATSSEPSDLPDLKKVQVHQWTFKNNGILFRNEDWDRLKKIAEGNPDEDKIGAFGVGFYSLFSVTEEPFVSSGNKWMGFHWNKDQLLARRGETEATDEEDEKWTSFEMPLREAGPIPVAFDFTRFLASSITFMTTLSEISVYLDGRRLVRLTKGNGVPKPLTFPRYMTTRGPARIMSAKQLRSTSVHIKSEVMRWVYTSGTEKPPPRASVVKVEDKPQGFFKSLFSFAAATTAPQFTPQPPPPPPVKKDPRKVEETSVNLSIFSMDMDVSLDKKMTAELYRSMQKNPPKAVKYSLIYTAKDEYDASKKEDEQVASELGSIFQGLRADLDGQGTTKLFIGHATAQTTGLGGHMASRFIPTVERETIDLADRNVAVWNRELLHMGGILARAAYEVEVDGIRELWQGAGPTPSDDLRSWLTARSLHALKFFTFHQSTPSHAVSSLIEAGFFGCTPTKNFPLLSTSGVRADCSVRMPHASYAAFLKQLPTVPAAIVDGAPAMVGALSARGIVRDVTFDDVLAELAARPLPEAEMVACMRWWADASRQLDRGRFESVRGQLLGAAVLVLDDGAAGERVLPLATIETYATPRTVVVLDGPLPPHLLPGKVSLKFEPMVLASAFGWSELSTVEWLEHLCSGAVVGKDAAHDLTANPEWAERVLTTLARAWPALSTALKGEALALLRDLTCIPTSTGMQKPQQAYFASADIFHDLPVVKLPSGTAVRGNLAKLLQDIGVRKHVELQLIFDRMIKTNQWTIPELVKYFASVQSTLSADEMRKLVSTKAFFAEGESQKEDGKQTRYLAKDLYEPLDVFRALGLPVIDWGTQVKWRSNSEEAQFLFKLGLRRSPPLPAIIALCASSDEKIRENAMKYLLSQFDQRYSKEYQPFDFRDVAFIPAMKGTMEKPEYCLVAPKEIYANVEWIVFGYTVVDPRAPKDIVTKLKIQKQPLTGLLVEHIRRHPPADEVQAKVWFSLLATRIADFTNAELVALSALNIVPVRDKETSALRHLPPTHCFFGGQSKAQLHSKLFVFVDFGSAANGFLSAVGTKQEPTVEQIAQILLADSYKFYQLSEGPLNFLNELRNIAVNSAMVSSTTLTRMKRGNVLLGIQRKPRQATSKEAELDDEDDWELQYDLKRPDEIVVADDSIALQLFGDKLFTAPQEDILEKFYGNLGSRRLSSIVKEDFNSGGEVPNHKPAHVIKALVLERLPLFLHDHSHARTMRVQLTQDNFIVRAFGTLAVTKSLNFGKLRLSHRQDASAVARRSGYHVELWVATNAQIDMYEVATSLNRILFESPRAHDALLFMTILSTDLKSLKRRGYNVDRILRQKKADHEAREAQHKATLLSAQKKQEEESVPSVPGGFAQAPPKDVKEPIPQPPPPVPPRASTDSVATAVEKAPSMVGTVTESLTRPQSTLQRWKSKFGAMPTPGPSLGGTSTPQPQPQGSAVTPWSDINRNVDIAMQGCRAESANVIKNGQERMERVREALNEGYCDISNQVGDLTQLDVPHKESFLERKRDALNRFIGVIMPLAHVYQLPLSSLHLFMDMSGGVIAFNRNGSIFLNLRYYEAWHDQEVRQGKLAQAFVSNYFTLAHEIAHNLVQPHNAEHEFYFSAICEKYMASFSQLLARAA